MEKTYAGRIKQGGQQTVKAPNQVAQKKGEVVVRKSGTDLRTGK